MTPKQQHYPAVLRDLLTVDVPYPLVPTQPVSAFGDQLAAFTHAELFGEQPITDPNMADACLSGLWLRFDFLDRSHTISQDLKTSTGSFWHGIMHRREPDWSNAKYWFRQVGSHDVFADLAAALPQIAGEFNSVVETKSLISDGTWDPFSYVDLCQSASKSGGDLGAFCVAIQKVEWELLFDWCYQRAVV